MKKIVVIGGGVSGLSVGCYAAMNGFEADVYEMHASPGGVCTSWRRKDFLFDHCLHWVIGSGRGNSMYPLFEEMHIADSVEFYHTDRFRRIRCDGKDVVIYTDAGKLEKELAGHFPGERQRIAKMMRVVRRFTRFHPPMDSDFGRFTIAEIIKMLPFMPAFLRLVSITVEDYINRFRDPVLREVLFRMFPVKDMPALMVIMPLAFFHNREGGYPMGGSLRLSEAIADNLKRMGGRLHTGQRVLKVVVEGGRAVGVETEDGKFHEADIVISACDGRTTLYEMLGGKYVPRAWKEMLEQPVLWPPLVNISLGVNRDLTGEVELNAFKPGEPLEVCNQKLDWIYYWHYCQDPAFAPKGKSVIEMQFETDHHYWKALYADKAAYEAEKQAVLEKLTGALETQLPGVKGQIEVSDVATPVTWEHYTGNWMGSYEGWMPTIKSFGKFLPRELPGLKNFFITGQWTFPGGGVPMCISQARRIVKEICRKEGRAFTVR
jgi:phytoene dehydrogenase-like protein